VCNVLTDTGQKFNIDKSGMYYVYFVNCKAAAMGTAAIDGTVTFMNPYGYLNGEMYYFMPFYLSVSILSVLCVGAWGILAYIHRDQLTALQKGIAGVIALFTFQCFVLYFDDLGYNWTGANYVAAMICGVLIATAVRTVSRALVLTICLGYEATITSFSMLQWKVIPLAVLYGIFSGMLNIAELIQRTTNVNTATLFLLVFPVGFFDITFGIWSIIAWVRTTRNLKLLEDTKKVKQYQIFGMILISVFGVSLSFVMSEALVVSATDFDDTWQTNWIWSAFWILFYFTVLASIAILWRPAGRYKYNKLHLEPEEEGEIALPLPVINSNSTALD